MDFELDELQVDLTDGFARLLDARCPSAAVRAIADQPGAVDRALWAELANAGVFSLAVSEDRGGAGLGWAHVVLAGEQLGKRFVPGPIAASIVAAVGGDEAAAAGERVVTYATPGEPVTVVAHLGGADAVWFVPEGAEGPVTEMAAADVPGVAAADPYDPLSPVWWVPALLAGTPLADIDPGAARVAIQLVESSQLLGLAVAAGEISVRYAGEREQFGRPIGSFQAVKHLAADQLVRSELARAAVYAAAVTWDSLGAPSLRKAPSAEVTRAIAAGKLLAAEAALANAKSAIQIHGGMGYTWEVDAHLLLKRAYVLAESLGGREALVETVAATL